MNVLNVLSNKSQVLKCMNLVYFQARNENHLHGPIQTLTQIQSSLNNHFFGIPESVLPTRLNQSAINK